MLNKKFLSGLACIAIGIVNIAVVINAENMSTNINNPPIVQVSNLQYSYDQMEQDLQDLQELYPGQIQVETLKITADGRNIEEVMLGDSNAKYHILIQATMHAREYMNTVLAMNQIEDYLRYFKERSYRNIQWNDLYENVCLHIIPMVNPDGVTISQSGVEAIKDKILKENIEECYQRAIAETGLDREEYFEQWKANARGVDINRNFDAWWDEYIGIEQASSERYKGEYPASEQETQAVLEVAEKYNLACCVGYHSYGNLIYWNYGSQGEILKKDQQLAECVSNVTGYGIHSTVQDSTDAAGCSDYFVLKLEIPAITIENGGSECPMPIEEYQPMYQNNQELWPALAYWCKETEN